MQRCTMPTAPGGRWVVQELSHYSYRAAGSSCLGGCRGSRKDDFLSSYFPPLGVTPVPVTRSCHNPSPPLSPCSRAGVEATLLARSRLEPRHGKWQLPGRDRDEVDGGTLDSPQEDLRSPEAVEKLRVVSLWMLCCSFCASMLLHSSSVAFLRSLKLEKQAVLVPCSQGEG